MNEERRKRLLSDDDIAAISDAVAQKHLICSLGFSSEDAALIKNHLTLYKKARNVIGTVILTALGLVLVGIFTKGFWVSLIEGIKK
jgi:hypothetical protein